MVEVDDDNDDLWDFSTPGGAISIPQSDSDSEDRDDEDDLRALPASKRRKLQKKLIVVPDLVVLDDSSEEEAPDPDLEIVEEIKRKSKAKQAARDDEIEFFDMASVAPVADGRLSEKYGATQANLHNNLAKLKAVKAMLNAEAPEPADLGDDPLGSQQATEDVREEGADPQLDPELDKIIVKVQGNTKEAPIKLRIGKRSPLEKLFNAFMKRAEELQWLSVGTPVKFVFDGEVMRPSDTAEELDIEEDCVIEAHWQDL